MLTKSGYIFNDSYKILQKVFRKLQLNWIPFLSTNGSQLEVAYIT